MKKVLVSFNCEPGKISILDNVCEMGDRAGYKINRSSLIREAIDRMIDSGYLTVIMNMINAEYVEGMRRSWDYAMGRIEGFEEAKESGDYDMMVKMGVIDPELYKLFDYINFDEYLKAVENKTATILLEPKDMN